MPASPDKRATADVPTIAGTSLAMADATVNKARIRRMLAACDVDPGRYAAKADPSLLGIDCILAIRKSKVRAPDRLVHLEQRMRITQTFAADEKLGVRAKVETVEQADGGEKARSLFEFMGRDGTPVATLWSTTMVAEPSWLRDVPPVQGDPRADWRLAGRKLLNSAKVQAYSEETGNRLHFDPAYAVRNGLRAPVANPLMTLTWAVEAISVQGLPASFEMNAHFQQPLHWDDGVDVLVHESGGRIHAVRCVSSAGALVSEIEVT